VEGEYIMKKSISLKDVAKLAGVGLGTASRVLNNHPSVTEETRKVVQEAMKELSYQPNAIARSLKMNSTMTVGILIPDISSAFFPEIVRGIEDIANQCQYNIILSNTDLDFDKEKDALNMFHEKKVDGVLFISNTVSSSAMEKFKEMNIPVVLVATRDKEGVLPSVTIDNEKAAYEAVDYLCRLGHKKIAMIAGLFDDPNAGIPRLQGYIRALSENGLRFDKDLIQQGDYGYKSGYDSIRELLDKNIVPTAVFAASDLMAIGASRAMLERGLRIPEDISIIGFDGVEAAEFFYPAITTMSQPRYEMGAEGMRLLTKLMNKEEIEEKNVLLEFELIERESCR
jgi:LacI family transcriptional regulator